jgi:hypothetical protein
MAPVFLKLKHTWRWVVNFLPPPLYPREEFFLYPLYRKVNWTQSGSDRCGEERNLLRPSGKKAQYDGLVEISKIWYWFRFCVPSIAVNASYVVGTVNRLRAGQVINRWSISGRDKQVAVLQNIRSFLGSTSWPGSLFPRVNQPQC